MNKQQIRRAIKLFNHRAHEARRAKTEAEAKRCFSLHHSGSARAYQFCADYLEANS